jgi:hypothetical protein
MWRLSVKLFGLILVLLCLVSLFLLPIIVRADGPPLIIVQQLYEIDWSKRIAYNVTDTGTHVLDGMRDTIVCDHGGKYTNIHWGMIFIHPPFSLNNSEDGWTFSNNVWSRRVFFTIGVVNSSGILFYPEDIPPEFIVYHMADLPSHIHTMLQLFNSRIGQPLYSPTYDFNNDGIINMRDITITIKNFALHSP